MANNTKGKKLFEDLTEHFEANKNIKCFTVTKDGNIKLSCDLSQDAKGEIAKEEKN